MTTAEFASQVLHGIGAPATTGNIHAVQLWIRTESGASPFRWNNPLNTTLGCCGWVESMNSVNVRRYPTPEAGVEATVRTLGAGWYRDLVAAFRAEASLDALYDAINQSPWCRGCTAGRYPSAFLAELHDVHPARPRASGPAAAAVDALSQVSRGWRPSAALLEIGLVVVLLALGLVMLGVG